MSNITDGQDIYKDHPRRSFDGKRIPNSAIFFKRTAIEFLQILFSQRAMGSYHYDQDDTKTEIQISDYGAADLDAINTRPSIIVARGPISWQGLGLGTNAIETRDMTSGDMVMSDLLTGSLNVTCMSREDIEAENIAYLAFNSFKFFAPILRKQGYFTVKSLNMGPCSLVEQEGRNDRTWLVPISIIVHAQERMSLTDGAARHLKEVIVEGLNASLSQDGG